MSKERWSIWYARVRFEDNPNLSKVRPVVLIDDHVLLCTVLPITSKLHHPGYIIKDWESAGLTKPSLVLLDGFIELQDSEFEDRIGELTEGDVHGLTQAILMGSYREWQS